ncbi:hypothetical protein BH23ACT2_BH23ACT2_19440 [soil metagenome]
MSGMGGPGRVVALVPDLMDRSRLDRLGDVEVVHVATPQALADTAGVDDLVVVDLSRPGVLDVVGALPGPVVGFASHVDTALLDAAREAGCQEVLPRSRFFSTLTARLAR